jgi:hypothetical protein
MVGVCNQRELPSHILDSNRDSFVCFANEDCGNKNLSGSRNGTPCAGRGLSQTFRPKIHRNAEGPRGSRGKAGVSFAFACCCSIYSVLGRAGLVFAFFLWSVLESLFHYLPILMPRSDVHDAALFSNQEDRIVLEKHDVGNKRVRYPGWVPKQILPE